ncbi:hypothetical protein NDU88_002237 [Pleurodeles waltl]|uniref:Uncharacterized protein n=1 Tax=Pleurodeles waltl TaxID=8319 RepID=A0AAV7VBZ3_PLEWA|nr:hypothetical protein NDU88_002237 [Pleurodeles waltl]
MCLGAAPLDRVSACEALFLPPSPVALYPLRVRVVSGARPQRHHSNKPPRVWFAGTIRPAMEPIGSLRWDPLGGMQWRGEKLHRFPGFTPRGLPLAEAPRPLTSTPVAPGHSALLSSGARASEVPSLRGLTASLASRRSRAPRCCMALLGPPVPWMTPGPDVLYRVPISRSGALCRIISPGPSRSFLLRRPTRAPSWLLNQRNAILMDFAKTLVSSL